MVYIGLFGFGFVTGITLARGQQRLNHPVLGLGHGLAFLGGEEVVDLLLGDIDVAHHVALLHALYRQIVSQVLAHHGVVLARLLQCNAELLERQSILAREACHRFIQLLVRNPHPVAVGQLHLDAIENQPIEGFPHQHLVLWHLYTARLEGCAHGLQALL